MARRPEITMRVVEETTSAEASRRPGIPVIPEKPLLDPGIGSHPPSRFGGKRVLILSMLGLAVLAAVLTWRYVSRTETTVFQFARLERGRIDSSVAATVACKRSGRCAGRKPSLQEYQGPLCRL